MSATYACPDCGTTDEELFTEDGDCLNCDVLLEDLDDDTGDEREELDMQIAHREDLLNRALELLRLVQESSVRIDSNWLEAVVALTQDVENLHR